MFQLPNVKYMSYSYIIIHLYIGLNTTLDTIARYLSDSEVMSVIPYRLSQ